MVITVVALVAVVVVAVAVVAVVVVVVAVVAVAIVVASAAHERAKRAQCAKRLQLKNKRVHCRLFPKHVHVVIPWDSLLLGFSSMLFSGFRYYPSLRIWIFRLCFRTF